MNPSFSKPMSSGTQRSRRRSRSVLRPRNVHDAPRPSASPLFVAVDRIGQASRRRLTLFRAPPSWLLRFASFAAPRQHWRSREHRRWGEARWRARAFIHLAGSQTLLRLVGCFPPSLAQTNPGRAFESSLNDENRRKDKSSGGSLKWSGRAAAGEHKSARTRTFGGEEEVAAAKGEMNATGMRGTRNEIKVVDSFGRRSVRRLPYARITYQFTLGLTRYEMLCSEGPRVNLKHI